MIKNVIEIMEKLSFTKNVQNELVTYLNVFLESPNFTDIVNSYDDINFDFIKSINDIKELAAENNICEYSAYMILFLCMAPKLHNRYKQKGIPDEIFYNTILDLKIFALGRLQFEINNTWFDCIVNGKQISKNTKVLSVHIPRTGLPLIHDQVIQSYKMAQKFFKDEFQDDIIFICNSWLLYPWNRTVYKNGSNLAQFYDDFTIVSSGEYNNYDELWRLFDCKINDLNNLPNDTSLRRAFINRMINQEPIGHGTGVLLFN